MIQSAFIRDILYAITEGEEAGTLLRSQLEQLTIKEIEYTQTGCFISFEIPHKGILEKKINRDLILDGLLVNSDELESGAEAILYITCGIITDLELWCLSGKYPQKELTNYSLSRAGSKAVI
ncbi:hypothetical protein Q0590_26520 [Rhodocytophaga aerolata]|uniref:Uncharacterized protein n=1 Tax=Rhodocytophaga aerolata TaxID=455078 RepID=A0ABT8RGM4_9BACT|nr:hypothetical protein [Rhodocytophaga aerolata]MDO1449862.1 hypothetical protein [Rhodocytophaga aerolata]